MKQIETIELFPQLTEELLNLLRTLNNSDWLKPSLIQDRTVKDLVSHLIDGSLRKLSIQRDGFDDKTNTPNINSYGDLVNHIQTLNSTWMNVSRRLSPSILIDLLEYSENQFYEFIKTLNPNDTALYGVDWAGEFESKNWFDIAWKIFTNTDRNKETYKSSIKTIGESKIGLKLLDYVTVMS